MTQRWRCAPAAEQRPHWSSANTIRVRIASSSCSRILVTEALAGSAANSLQRNIDDHQSVRRGEGDEDDEGGRGRAVRLRPALHMLRAS